MASPTLPFTARATSIALENGLGLSRFTPKNQPVPIAPPPPNAIEVTDCILEGELLSYDEDLEKIESLGAIQEYRAGWNKNIDPRIESGRRHLQIAFFDCLHLNAKDISWHSHSARREKLERVVPAGDVTEEDARPLTEYYGEILSRPAEGLVIKGLNSKYEFGEKNKAWVKLKPDYSPGGGDCDDYALIGGSYEDEFRTRYAKHDKKKIQDLLTAFYIGCLKNKNDFKRDKAEKAHFQIVFKVDCGLNEKESERLAMQARECRIRRADLRKHPLPYDLDTRKGISMNQIDYFFPEPFIVELKGGGFSFDLDAQLWLLRSPRIMKMHKDRFPEDTVSLQELQELGAKFDKSLNAVEKAALEEKLHDEAARTARGLNARRSRECKVPLTLLNKRKREDPGSDGPGEEEIAKRRQAEEQEREVNNLFALVTKSPPKKQEAGDSWKWSFFSGTTICDEEGGADYGGLGKVVETGGVGEEVQASGTRPRVDVSLLPGTDDYRGQLLQQADRSALPIERGIGADDELDTDADADYDATDYGPDGGKTDEELPRPAEKPSAFVAPFLGCISSPLAAPHPDPPSTTVRPSRHLAPSEPPARPSRIFVSSSPGGMLRVCPPPANANSTPLTLRYERSPSTTHGSPRLNSNQPLEDSGDEMSDADPAATTSHADVTDDDESIDFAQDLDRARAIQDSPPTHLTAALSAYWNPNTAFIYAHPPAFQNWKEETKRLVDRGFRRLLYTAEAVIGAAGWRGGQPGRGWECGVVIVVRNALKDGVLDAVRLLRKLRNECAQSISADTPHRPVIIVDQSSLLVEEAPYPYPAFIWAGDLRFEWTLEGS
ncbi:hypothetical protein BDK51DRAFT_26197 [Blyttiomyces helicus]|uniref:ATP-dependent DNA ligase family profile domain-containing protein n=1 Tax=Blyttiomyces helicus TaxID=388810 RepID=A0A4P9WHP0_9FUNG|nr:hypothetical protein BDK51DRAFT_26197 [Blyttiomyces helicus]|eukprot:RKO92349.1 hypothetical protein BDK51DRAFT_26197 [Blyttiomyces helicus]